MPKKNHTKTKKIKTKLKTLSLFTGAGGFDIGFHRAGFEIVACVEIDKRFCKTLLDNPKYFGSAKIINKDIRLFSSNEITMPKRKDIDFVIGGPPCQSFSAQGFRNGLDDKRGTLFEHYIRVLKEIKPKGFLFENVRGILYANGGKGWDIILSSFKKLGYHVTHRLLNAADYGVPQFRERVFILGGRDKDLLFPAPTHGPDSKTKTPYITALNAIEDIYNPKEKQKPFGGKYGHLVPLVPEGDNYSYFTAERGYSPPVFKWRSKFSNFLYKIAKDKPCRTIQAQPGKGSGPLHWLNRKLNADELMRLQTFPKDFRLDCGLNLAHHQIGNSVPPRLAHALAKSIYRQLNGCKVNGENLITDSFKFSFDARKGILAKKTRKEREKNLAKKKDQLELANLT